MKENTYIYRELMDKLNESAMLVNNYLLSDLRSDDHVADPAQVEKCFSGLMDEYGKDPKNPVVLRQPGGGDEHHAQAGGGDRQVPGRAGGRVPRGHDGDDGQEHECPSSAAGKGVCVRLWTFCGLFVIMRASGAP